VPLRGSTNIRVGRPAPDTAAGGPFVGTASVAGAGAVTAVVTQDAGTSTAASGASAVTAVATQVAPATAAGAGSVTDVVTQIAPAAAAGAGAVTDVVTEQPIASATGAAAVADAVTQIAGSPAAGAGSVTALVTQIATAAAAGAAAVTAAGVTAGAAASGLPGYLPRPPGWFPGADRVTAQPGGIPFYVIPQPTRQNAATAAGITLVSQGAIAASGSPAFGAATTAGDLLVAFVVSSGSTAAATITTAASGWALAAAGGSAFIWSSVWYKPNCAAGETAPVFTDPNGSIQFSQLAEYAGAAAVSPVDHAAGVSGGGAVPTFSVNLPPDTQAGDLVVACGFWNGSTSGGTVSIWQFTDSAGTAITPHLQQASSGGVYLASLWGIAGNTGSSGDTAYLSLSTFDTAAGTVVSFKAANPVAYPLTVPPAQALPVTWLNFPYSTRALAATGGTPPYTWSLASGSLPTGMSMSAGGVLTAASCTAAGTFNFTPQVTDSVSSTAQGAQSIVVGSPRGSFTSLTTTTSLTGVLGAYLDPAEMTAASNGFNSYVSANEVGPVNYVTTLGAYSPSMWYTTADAGPAQTGQVQMGPCNLQQFDNWGSNGWNGSSNTPLSAFTSLTCTYDVTSPIGGAYELEFDIWTGYRGATGAHTTVASGSNGGQISTIASWANPSAGVLAVASTAGFPASGSVQVQASGSTWAVVSYTAIAGNTFTGCTYVSGSATGTVSTGGSVDQMTTRDIMLWLDTSTERNTGGAILHTPDLTFGGLTFDLYYYPNPYPNGPITGAELIFILQGAGGSGTFGHLTAGTVDILGPLNYLVSQGFNLGAPPYLYLSLFGWEICNTDVQPDSGTTQASTFICNSFTYNYALSGISTGAAAGAGAVTAVATVIAPAAGAGAGTVTDVVTQTATATAAGAGSVTATASGGGGTATAAGAGAVTDVVTQIAKATAAGAGSVTDVATQIAKATAAGAGTVNATGVILGAGNVAGAGAATAKAVQAPIASPAAAGVLSALATQQATALIAGGGQVTAAAIITAPVTYGTARQGTMTIPHAESGTGHAAPAYTPAYEPDYGSGAGHAQAGTMTQPRAQQGNP
jgi:hypothetical protein